MMLAAASNRWTRTRGLVLEAWFDESREAMGDSYDDNEIVHSANVRFSYRVGVRQHESTRLSYRPSSGPRFSDVVGLLRGVIKGKEVDVYYDPEKPERAVIVRGGSIDNVLRVAVALATVAYLGWMQLS